jgi:hypothetical protein
VGFTILSGPTIDMLVEPLRRSPQSLCGPE